METIAVDDLDARREVIDDHLLIGDVHRQRHDAAAARRHYETAIQFAYALHNDMPRALYVIRQMADGYVRIGRVDAASAGGREAAATRRESCRLARASFQHAIEVWKMWSEKGGAASYRERRQRVIASDLSVCDE